MQKNQQLRTFSFFKEKLTISRWSWGEQKNERVFLADLAQLEHTAGSRQKEMERPMSTLRVRTCRWKWQTTSPREAVTYQCFSSNTFFVGSRICRKWCLEYLRASIPSSHQSLLRHVLDEDGRTVDDPSEAGKLLHAMWSKQFDELQTTHELKPFLNKLPLPSFAEFSVDLSTKEIHKTIRSLSNDSAPGPDGITNVLIKGANVFIPVVRRIYRQMSSGSLPS